MTYTTKEFAEFHKVTEQTVRAWIKQGRVQTMPKSARRWVIISLELKPESI